MYHKNPNAVRRAHSFDSSDNLERWQNIRDHRKQFLSTRAKFDKVPPTEPPPPPPRQESKYTTLLNRSVSSSFSSSTSLESQAYYFKEKSKSFRTERNLGDVNSSFCRTSNEPKRSNSFQKYLTDRTNKYPQTEKLTLEKRNSFQTSEKQKSYIELKQSWLKVKDMKNQSQLDGPVNEPLAVKKTVDSLGYEIPTPFQEVGARSEKLHHTPDRPVESSLTLDSYLNKTETHGREEIKVSIESGNDYYLRRPSEYYNVSGDNQKKQNFEDMKSLDYHSVSRYSPEKQNFEESSDISILTNQYQDLLFQDDTNLHKKQDNKKNSDSNWKIFTQSLLDAIESTPVNDSEDKFISNNTKPVMSERTRRVSTGSVHDPIIWRSLYPSTPVKTLVQKFSKK